MFEVFDKFAFSKLATGFWLPSPNLGIKVTSSKLKSVSVKLLSLVVKLGSSGLTFKTAVLSKKISAKQALL